MASFLLWYSQPRQQISKLTATWNLHMHDVIYEDLRLYVIVVSKAFDSISYIPSFEEQSWRLYGILKMATIIEINLSCRCHHRVNQVFVKIFDWKCKNVEPDSEFEALRAKPYLKNLWLLSSTNCLSQENASKKDKRRKKQNIWQLCVLIENGMSSVFQGSFL